MENVDYKEELFKVLNTYFFKGLKAHVEGCLKNKWGEKWAINLKEEFTDNWRNTLEFNTTSGQPNWDLSKLIHIFTNYDLLKDFKITRFEKNIADVIKDSRNQVAHDNPINLEYFMMIIVCTKIVSNYFDDKSCFESINQLSKKYFKSSKNINVIVGSSNESDVAEIDSGNYVINEMEKNIGPLKLINVREGYRGKNNSKAIFLRFNEFEDEKACNFSAGYNERLEKCKSLLDKYVTVFWASDTYTFAKGWFSDLKIYSRNSVL